MKKKQSMETRILESAIRLVEKNGVRDVTVRKIADHAGVNVAAINYYFRNKRGLMDALYQHTLNHALKDWYAILDQKDIPIQSRVRRFLGDLIQGGLRYPGITKAHLHDPFFHGEYGTLFVPQMNGFLKKLGAEMAPALPAKSRPHIRWMLAETMASLLFFITMPDLFQPFWETGFRNTSAQAAYIDYLVDKLFAKPSVSPAKR